MPSWRSCCARPGRSWQPNRKTYCPTRPSNSRQRPTIAGTRSLNCPAPRALWAGAQGSEIQRRRSRPGITGTGRRVDRLLGKAAGGIREGAHRYFRRGETAEVFCAGGMISCCHADHRRFARPIRCRRMGTVLTRRRGNNFTFASADIGGTLPLGCLGRLLGLVTVQCIPRLREWTLGDLWYKPKHLFPEVHTPERPVHVYAE